MYSFLVLRFNKQMFFLSHRLFLGDHYRDIYIILSDSFRSKTILGPIKNQVILKLLILIILILGISHHTQDSIFISPLCYRCAHPLITLFFVFAVIDVQTPL